MYIDHDRLCVCLSIAAFPYYCTDPDVTLGNGRGAPSCALLGGGLQYCTGFVAVLLWQHSAAREMSASACTRSVPGLSCHLTVCSALDSCLLCRVKCQGCCLQLHVITRLSGRQNMPVLLTTLLVTTASLILISMAYTLI